MFMEVEELYEDRRNNNILVECTLGGGLSEFFHYFFFVRYPFLCWGLSVLRN